MKLKIKGEPIQEQEIKEIALEGSSTSTDVNIMINGSLIAWFKENGCFKIHKSNLKEKGFEILEI